MTESDSKTLLRKAAPECMVLLKSDGSFPLFGPCEIALYGSGARHTKKGGTGSGDVNVKSFTTIEKALQQAGFTITTAAWLDAYDALYKEANRNFKDQLKKRIEAEGLSAFLDCMGAVMPEPEYDLPLAGDGDTAVYILSRTSGEGTDRTAEKGDFLLTDTEVRDILEAARRYRRFLLVLNVGGVVDLSPVISQTPNILLLSQTGGQTAEAFCDVLLGQSYPSGKLSATWASIDDYCHEGDFGQQDDTRYREGIYVGYRYFDTVGKTPLFPFGYGCAYTTFAYMVTDIVHEKSRVYVNIRVTNTGTQKGKEVLQLYVSIPSARLDQPYQVLATFAKTRELLPDETEELRLSFDLTDLASYDSFISVRVLEKGNYILRAGTNSRDTQACGVIVLKEDIVCEELTALYHQPDFNDFLPETHPFAQTLTDSLPFRIELSEIDFSPTENGDPPAGTKSETLAQPEHDSILKDTDIKDLAYLCIGRFEEAGSKSMIGNAGLQVAGAAGETTGKFSEKGIPSIIMADGPAGLRLAPTYGKDEQGIYSLDDGNLAEYMELLPDRLKSLMQPAGQKPERHGQIFEQNCSAIPIGTAIAQSFNLDLAEKLGNLVAEEMREYHVDLWLAPAMNIQRYPLCGRNFEYYSEDPLLSGLMAAAVTSGVQKNKGCGVTLKHFACNNQETNRIHSNSIVSERALRDIYLKGFEIAVKFFHPIAIMTSYNLLNGEHTSSSKNLLDGVLRKEWGYDGLVMTDWIVQGLADKKHKHPSACASGAVQAGNDLVMPGSQKDYENLTEALENDYAEYPVSKDAVQKSAGRVMTALRLLRKEPHKR